MHDSTAIAFATAISLGWCALALAWIARRSGIVPYLRRRWRGSGAFTRIAAVAALVAVSVYGGSKSGGTGGTRPEGRISAAIPRPVLPASPGDSSTNALRFTAFAFDGDDRFDFAVAWPATNLPEYAAIDVFHKRTLSDPAWRWIYRREVWPENGETEFSLSGDDLPYWEEVVSRRFRVYTNEVESPFGVVFTNLYARVPEPTDAAPRSAFFMLAGQRDTDGDELSDAIERSLGYDPSDPDMDGDGLPDGQELALGANPLATDSDGDGLADGEEVSWGRSSTDGLLRWIDNSAAARTVLFTDADDDCVSIPMPFPIHVAGAAMTNLTVNANGLIGFSAGEAAFGNGWSLNEDASSLPLADASATVAAFWGDLRVRPDMDSEVSLSVCGESPERVAVLEFSRVGFYSDGTNDCVSFQVQFRESETNTVHVVFLEASGRGTGASATLGARSSRDDGVEYSYNEAGAVYPGLHIEYHFGIGSDPSKEDTDGDGLPDPEELALGTNPSKSDTDGDGMSDCAEVAQGTNPVSPDTDGDGIGDKWETDHPPFDPLDNSDGLADADGDGLSNAFEITQSGTDWQRADTDDDGLSDFAEWNGTTDPFDPDCDGDGLLDGAEVFLGTDPLDDDTDGDDMPDGWEVELGVDPLDDADPNPSHDGDGDGLSCLEEARFGTSPFAADTDGDGLTDGEECGCVFVLSFPQPTFDMSGATNVIGMIDNLDEGCLSIPLPFPIQPTAMAVCSNVIVGINGCLALATDGGDTFPSGAYSARPVVVNAFLDDLVAYTNELGSALSVATFGTNGFRRFVVEYRSFGFWNVDPVETNSVSFQVELAEDEPDIVRIWYFRAAPRRSDLSDRALGDDAELGLETERRHLVHSLDAPVAHPGLALEYHLGTGTSPTEADIDGDGLDDGEELEAGTDPLDWDTDSDGLPDGWECETGLDPLAGPDGAADSDNDGLSNTEEYLNGTDPLDPDTDGDGVSDGVEVAHGSDPCNAGDEGMAPESDALLAMPFYVRGDYAAWEMEIHATEGDTRTFKFSTSIPGQSNTRSFLLHRGASYEISLRWRGDGNHHDHEWFCWEAKIGDPLSPSSRCFDDYSPTRLEGNEILVGEGWICENADGLLTSHVHTHDGEGGNIAAGKTATLHVLKTSVEISKGEVANWVEMDQSDVILSDENMGIRIVVEPTVPSFDALTNALGNSFIITSYTKPEGAAVTLSSADQFVQNDNSSEVRITKTRSQLKALGLLPANEEDGVNEMAWVDIVRTPGQSYADSEAFSALGYGFRGKATLETTHNLESSPPNSIPSASFFKAAGCELLFVAYGGTTSVKRQIMNQADYFYFSGHGNHNTGTIQNGFSPQMAAQYWCHDLDCVIIAGCSVLDINDYNNNFSGEAHSLSPGKNWEQTGPNILLGYCYKAPLDSTEAPARIVTQWRSNRSEQGDVAAWMNANDNRNGRNACAIEKGLRFHYFKRSFKHFYTKKSVDKEDW